MFKENGCHTPSAEAFGVGSKHQIPCAAVRGIIARSDDSNSRVRLVGGCKTLVIWDNKQPIWRNPAWPSRTGFAFSLLLKRVIQK